MKLQQQERILASTCARAALKEKLSKKEIKVFNLRARARATIARARALWLEKKETLRGITAKKLSELRNLFVKKIRGFINWLNYPAIERSMYALERSQSVKAWLKYPTSEIKLKYVIERRASLTKIMDKRRKNLHAIVLD